MRDEAPLKMRVASKQAVSEGVVALELEPVELDVSLPAWGPGAHIDLLDGNGLVRQYSLCGPRGAGHYEVAVLRAEGGRGGSAWVHDELSVGDELQVKGPRNHFELLPAESYLFVAGGIGITPIFAMVREVEARGADWRLVYGGRSRRSMAFLEELSAYGDRVTLVPQDEDGLIDVEAELGPHDPGRHVYCCGPEPLLAAVEAVVRERPERLHVERFSPRGELDTSGEAFEVEIASSGQRVKVEEGESIIDALQAIGMDVDFSCREGTCGTCETGVLGGVPDHRDSVLDDDERAANDCMMICVGRCIEGPLLLDL